MIAPLIVLAYLLGVYWLLLGRPRIRREHLCRPKHRGLHHRVLGLAAPVALLAWWHRMIEMMLILALVLAMLLIAAIIGLYRRRARRRPFHSAR